MTRQISMFVPAIALACLVLGLSACATTEQQPAVPISGEFPANMAGRTWSGTGIVDRPGIPPSPIEFQISQVSPEQLVKGRIRWQGGGAGGRWWDWNSKLDGNRLQFTVGPGIVFTLTADPTNLVISGSTTGGMGNFSSLRLTPDR